MGSGNDLDSKVAPSSEISRELALYWHIPFCAALCHYCDFAKTANYTKGHVESFFMTLEREGQRWFEWYSQTFGQRPSVTSLFVGGGTPSLFTTEFQPLFNWVRPYLVDRSEITLEANPEMVTEESCQQWRQLGFNRISLGVQSFSPRGLQLLTRTHSPDRAATAISLALEYFPKVGVDLIFGWQGQTLAEWDADLQRIVELGPGHISTYELTFEGQTPFNRLYKRGAVQPCDEQWFVEADALTKRHLTEAEYRHEEVSNWRRGDQTCEHNWSYWEMRPYLGIGPGAHSHLYLKDQPIGIRFAYDPKMRRFLGVDTSKGGVPLGQHQFHVELDQDRDPTSWLMEYLAVGLRTERGVDLGRCQQVGQLPPNLTWPSPFVVQGGTIRLPEEEWLRTDAWVRQILARLP